MGRTVAVECRGLPGGWASPKGHSARRILSMYKRLFEIGVEYRSTARSRSKTLGTCGSRVSVSARFGETVKAGNQRHSQGGASNGNVVDSRQVVRRKVRRVTDERNEDAVLDQRTERREDGAVGLLGGCE